MLNIKQIWNQFNFFDDEVNGDQYITQQITMNDLVERVRAQINSRKSSGYGEYEPQQYCQYLEQN